MSTTMTVHSGFSTSYRTGNIPPSRLSRHSIKIKSSSSFPNLLSLYQSPIREEVKFVLLFGRPCFRSFNRSSFDRSFVCTQVRSSKPARQATLKQIVFKIENCMRNINCKSSYKVGHCVRGFFSTCCMMLSVFDPKTFCSNDRMLLFNRVSDTQTVMVKLCSLSLFYSSVFRLTCF